MNIDVQTIGHRTVTLWDSSSIHLNHLWEDGPLVLVFLRHYG